MRCPICKEGIGTTETNYALYKLGRISYYEAQKRSLISHVRHAHTDYDYYANTHSDEDRNAIRDRYNAIARKMLGFRESGFSWVEEKRKMEEKMKKLSEYKNALLEYYYGDVGTGKVKKQRIKELYKMGLWVKGEDF